MEEMQKENSVELLVEQKLKAEKQKMEEEFNSRLEKVQSETEKMGQLSEEEKARYLLQKQEEALAKREAEITKRELRSEGVQLLAKKKLPLDFIDCMALDTKENLQGSIETIEKLFMKAVEEQVNARLVAQPPKAKGNYERDPFLQGLKN